MITQEQFEALNAKLDMYIDCQNKREKDFNELERDMLRLKNTMNDLRNDVFRPLPQGERVMNYERRDMLEAQQQKLYYPTADAGVAWLR